MTSNPMDWKAGINPRLAENQNAANCMLPMGEFQRFLLHLTRLLLHAPETTRYPFSHPMLWCQVSHLRTWLPSMG